MENRKFRYMSASNRAFYIFNAIFWVVVMFIVIYPLYLVVISSISDPDAVAAGEVLWRPVDLSFIGYEAIFHNKEIWIGYGNSLFYTVAGIAISIFVTLCTGYVMTRKNLAGKKIINFFFLIPMFFSGGLIPTFLVMNQMGLYNTRAMLILNACLTTWNLMVTRTYIQTTIPDELYEAAALDGASHFQYFTKVVVPLSRTIMSVLAVYYGVAKWNDYYTGLVYIRDRVKYPLQTILREILATLNVSLADEVIENMDIESLEQMYRIAEATKYCSIVIAALPVMLLYIFLQKYFEKGIMIGSLKG